jgi:hypothetical protein
MTTEHLDVDHASRPNAATVIGCRGAPIGIRAEAGLTVITISGEIEATDIDDLSPQARGLVRECGVLIVDISSAEFMAVDGLRALVALWSADPTTELPRVRVMRICFEQITVVLRRGG